MYSAWTILMVYIDIPSVLSSVDYYDQMSEKHVNTCNYY